MIKNGINSGKKGLAKGGGLPHYKTEKTTRSQEKTTRIEQKDERAKKRAQRKR